MTIKDLMQRYKITRQAVLHFVKKNIANINANGEHARQLSEGWQFDAEAVRIIDDLRGFSQVTVVEQEESERVKELQQENEDLRQLLLIAQSKLIKSQEELNENQKMLSDFEKKFLAAESQSKDSQAELTLEQALHKVTKQQLEDSKRIFNETKSQLENQLDESNRQLEKIKNRGLFDRIFNNF